MKVFWVIAMLLAENTFRIWLLDRQGTLELVTSDSSGTLAREISAEPLYRFLRSWTAFSEHCMAMGRMSRKADAELKDLSLALAGLLLVGKRVTGRRLEYSTDSEWSALPVEILPCRDGLAGQKMEIVRDLRIQSASANGGDSEARHGKGSSLVIFPAPSKDLEASLEEEVEALSSSRFIQNRLRPSVKKRWNWSELLRMSSNGDYWHFAGHAKANRVSLGGLTLAPPDIRSLHLQVPVLFLNGCHTGIGGGADSLVAAFLAAGVGAVVGYLGRIEGRYASVAALAFWEAMARGNTPSMALHKARGEIESRFGKGHPASVFLVCYSSRKFAAKAPGILRRVVLGVGASAFLILSLALLANTWPGNSGNIVLSDGVDSKGSRPPENASDIQSSNTVSQRRFRTPMVKRGPQASADDGKEAEEFVQKPLAGRLQREELNSGDESSTESISHADADPISHSDADPISHSDPDPISHAETETISKADSETTGSTDPEVKGNAESEFEILGRTFVKSDHPFYSATARKRILEGLRKLDATETEKLVRLRSHMLADGASDRRPEE
ncbi:MAG: CHAT domain-containing protein [Leptospiraceae bacterium]|nr:CHAT domain-containing protein [Leptospiraceae bacterium]